MTLGGADKFNLDLLGQLTGRGWEVTCATTLQGDHSWMPEFSGLTPDIFAMPHFLEAADYPRFLSYLIQSRQIDTVLISNSLIGYQLLPFLRSQFPEVTILDYCHMEDQEWLDGGYPRLSLKNALLPGFECGFFPAPQALDGGEIRPIRTRLRSATPILTPGNGNPDAARPATGAKSIRTSGQSFSHPLRRACR